MKKQPDIYLYLLRKVRGWCKKQDMTDPEMYFHCTFREFLRRYGMLLTKIETRNNQTGGYHTFTFTPVPECLVFGGTNQDLVSVFDRYVSFLDYFQYEDITVIRNHGGIISIRCYYPI